MEKGIFKTTKMSKNESVDSSVENEKVNAVKDIVAEGVKNVVNGAVKGTAGAATTAIAGSMFSAYLLPIIASLFAIGVLTTGGIALYQYVTKELTIDKTANVVEKIREISEFTTACYYEEAVLQREKVEAGEQNRFMSLANIEADSVYSEIVILAKGRVRAGYDLSKVAADQIKVGGDSISIVLPKPEIFDVIANPSDYEMYIEEGKWSHEEISALQANYREALKASSLEYGILEKADKSGKERLELFLKAFGFSYIELIQAN